MQKDAQRAPLAFHQHEPLVADGFHHSAMHRFAAFVAINDQIVGLRLIHEKVAVIGQNLIHRRARDHKQAARENPAVAITGAVGPSTGDDPPRGMGGEQLAGTTFALVPHVLLVALLQVELRERYEPAQIGIGDEIGPGLGD